MRGFKDADFADLAGLTLVKAQPNEANNELLFVTDKGRIFRQYHSQDCCESVSIDDIAGDLQDLIGAPILQAEVATNSDQGARDEYDESYTWTFYKLATIKGSVTIRWYGTSNGYYSEGVDFVEEAA